MTIKKNLETEGTDTRWRNKGMAHATKNKAPRICHACAGMGQIRLNRVYVDCLVCNGTGERI